MEWSELLVIALNEFDSSSAQKVMFQVEATPLWLNNTCAHILELLSHLLQRYWKLEEIRIMALDLSRLGLKRTYRIRWRGLQLHWKFRLVDVLACRLLPIRISEYGLWSLMITSQHQWILVKSLGSLLDLLHAWLLTLLHYGIHLFICFNKI